MWLSLISSGLLGIKRLSLQVSLFFVNFFCLIIRDCDSDELVSSTERHSGFSLVCSTLIELNNRLSSVFMATHIHELSTYHRITSLNNLKIYLVFAFHFLSSLFYL